MHTEISWGNVLVIGHLEEGGVAVGQHEGMS
jgi:hypothetical protein